MNTLTFFAVFTVNMSSPELTLVQSTNGATVQCGVRCSPCELEMELLDDKGSVLPSDEQKFPSEERGFFNVTRRILVPDHTTRFEFASELSHIHILLNILHLKGQFTLEPDGGFLINEGDIFDYSKIMS